MIAVFVQERLKDEYRGDLVDYVLVILAGLAGLVEDLVGLASGEPFIPEMDWEPGERAQLGGKLLRFRGARAGFAGEMERVADDDGGDGETAREAGDGTKVVAAVAVDFEREDRLGGEAEFIGDGDTDAFDAYIEAEVARRGW